MTRTLHFQCEDMGLIPIEDIRKKKENTFCFIKNLYKYIGSDPGSE